MSIYTCKNCNRKSDIVPLNERCPFCIAKEAYDRGAAEATLVANEVIQKAREEGRREVREKVNDEISSVYGMLLDEFAYTGLATEQQWNESISPAFTRLGNVVCGNPADAPTARVYKFPRDLTK